MPIVRLGYDIELGSRVGITYFPSFYLESEKLERVVRNLIQPIESRSMFFRKFARYPDYGHGLEATGVSEQLS